ncbi:MULTISPECIES: class I SAM-dependent methyltransferase [unclassified Tolypothrix]|uniref:class I SAM-dependent methyltransferase n=1 Tax=unclassified Tolypothrix TaxID=2649714 RepID=UPI0005EABA60|nr:MULTISPECIES: methyltransferase domain-containing protein [unclassified Tolypothrix]BAY91944.1 hypothetical protein NIES3275_39730 [Microchaete diplosiphon NIES-3275]EKF04879.1 methyltransferase domain protein [Tolypothrix sp. PCC 7601]MBE9082724.1 class I SAM-dependent methyltransferase [Tolypothrix sp. LEGE 11397]UYD25943.1 class I SAM-dependent methyltransferase [Tolypothrix sp. PCC 7712]UYD31818.1 class I SAM-dependent methyltransferase [Tolypothrix sp. PCC 7601]
MQNKDFWEETKFVQTTKGYRASNNPIHVGVGSRFIVNILGRTYEPLINKYAKGLLLDLGCGNVPLYAMYRDKIVDNVCVDWSNSIHKNKYLDYVFDLNDRLLLESEQFDTILLTDVLEHIANPEFLINEITRLLKPGGHLILTVPFFYWIHEQPHDYFRYTEFCIKRFCENNKLNVILLEPYGGAPEIILDIVAKNLMDVSPMLCKIHCNVSTLFINSYIGKKISTKTSKSFPLGYSLIAQKGKL